MSELTEMPPIDKSTWGPGPWQDEPDRVEWEHAGRPCLIVRQERLGHLCGYAAVDPGHPFHEKHYDDLPDYGPEVHGGLTYADSCQHHVCHIPKPGKPDDVWWFGFDCAHYMDISPGMEATLRELREKDAAIGALVTGMHVPQHYRELDDYRYYKPVGYLVQETNTLAEYLAKVMVEHRERRRLELRAKRERKRRRQRTGQR